jgi:hypothetical protein
MTYWLTYFTGLTGGDIKNLPDLDDVLAANENSISINHLCVA